jgi:hypothetical protein
MRTRRPLVTVTCLNYQIIKRARPALPGVPTEISDFRSGNPVRAQDGKTMKITKAVSAKGRSTRGELQLSLRI